LRYQALQVQYPDSPTKAPPCRRISPYRSSSGFPFSQTRASQKYRKPFRFSHRAKQLALMWRYRTLQVQYPDWIFCSQTLQKILNRASILPRKHLSAGESLLTGAVQVSHFLKPELLKNIGNLFDSPTEPSSWLLSSTNTKN